MAIASPNAALFRSRLFSPATIAVIAVLLLMLTLREGVAHLLEAWRQPGFSHGFIIPIVSIYLFWRLRHELVPRPRDGQWVGAALVVVALIVGILGNLVSFYVVIDIAIIMGLAGLAVASLGIRNSLRLWMPILLLLLIIPLPDYLMFRMSRELQLIASHIAAGLIQLTGMSVFVEANIIDLGLYQLHVADACSGLRYIFSLFSFGALIGYLYQGPTWKRITILFSTIPIAIMMNSIRIAMVAWLFNIYGISPGETFLHYFQGWVVFALCLLLLFAEVCILSKITLNPSKSLDHIMLRAPEPTLRQHCGTPFTTSLGLAICVLFLTVGAALTTVSVEQAMAVAPREPFTRFPADIGPWQGTLQISEAHILAEQNPTDYVITEYRTGLRKPPIKLYAAYFETQLNGKVTHSPRISVSDGWEIESIDVRKIDGLSVPGGRIAVNRVLTRYGNAYQVSYYWFAQRDRVMTNEFAVKWYIVWDSLTRGRSDGAVIRLVTPLAQWERLEDADARLQAFLAPALPQLKRFLP